jgi:hypothetical protein
VKPTRTLTRVPIFDGTMATFTGRLNAPARVVIPPAMASAVPAGETFGPMPNSIPVGPRTPAIQLTLGRKVLCSRPPMSTTHSVTAESPVSPV